MSLTNKGTAPKFFRNEGEKHQYVSLIAQIERMPQDTFEERKAYRVAKFNAFQYGNKLITCVACNGSGYYDNHDSPKCGSCNGTGKVRERE